MKPVPDYHQITSDLFVWHGYNPECKTDCTSTAIRTPDGFVLIDPVRLEEQAIERMVGDDRVVAVLLTNGNHLRGSLYEKERFDVPIYAPNGAQGIIPVDRVVSDGELLFETLRVIPLPGEVPGKRPTCARRGGDRRCGDKSRRLADLAREILRRPATANRIFA